MLAHQFRDHDDTPIEDKVVVLHDATWADYQRLIEMRGDHAAPRIAFLEGHLEVMSPSKTHESLKSKIGRLIEVWCLEKGLDFEPCGSWTIANKDVARGAEPDECYVFGDLQSADRPDLAIEVIWTSGGLNKLEIYRKLSVHEVWFWRRGKITVHVLRGEEYGEADLSEVLPGIDLEQLARHLDQPTPEAIRSWRAWLQTVGGRPRT